MQKYLLSFVIGFVLALVGAGFFYFDAQAKSSAIIGQLRANQRTAVNRLSDIANTSAGIKDNAQRQLVLIRGLREVINLLPDAQ